jgi:two-component system OmpR family sensor kinase
VVLTQASLAELRGIALELDAPTPALVAGTTDALAVLLSNLVDNAIKYTPAGGRVHVTVICDDARCQIVVEDSGCGVPPEERERIFDRFYRRPGTGASGSGLGLAIVKDIAVRHQATIELRASSSLGGLYVQVTFARPASRSGS